MPTLIVLRHAKAIAGLGLADIDRPLAERGRLDARAAGDWLREYALVPDQVRCSTAVRTRQTVEELALPSPVEFESRIYDNDVDALLDLVRETDHDVGTLLLVGHNPSMHSLVLELVGDAPDGFPTCAFAVIELASPWPETAPNTGTLVTYRTPKD